MPSRYCPRCYTHRPDYLFQDPVQMCLVCYGGLARNASIAKDFYALKEKARKSRYARRLRASQDRELLEQELIASARKSFDSQAPSPSPSGDEILASCDGPCRRLVPYDSLKPDNRSTSNAEYPPMLCKECTELRSTLPAGMFQEKFYLKGIFWGHEETEEETVWKANHFKVG